MQHTQQVSRKYRAFLFISVFEQDDSNDLGGHRSHKAKIKNYKKEKKR